MKHFFYYLLCPFFFTACAKDSFTTVTIKGNLLISSSNPVPVPGYVLTFYQSKRSESLDSSITNATVFIDAATTDASGYFEEHITTNKNGVEHSIGATGDKSSVPQADFRGLALSDQDLGTLYLYKKIARAILTISTTAGISPSDTLFTAVATAGGYREKAITNLSIPAGTAGYSIDTVPDLIFTRYSIAAHQYYNDISIRKSGASVRFAATSGETEGDEAEKTYTISIP